MSLRLALHLRFAKSFSINIFCLISYLSKNGMDIDDTGTATSPIVLNDTPASTPPATIGAALTKVTPLLFRRRRSSCSEVVRLYLWLLFIAG